MLDIRVEKFLKLLVWPRINITTLNVEDRIMIAHGFRDLIEHGVMYNIDDIYDWVATEDPIWSNNTSDFILKTAGVFYYGFLRDYT